MTQNTYEPPLFEYTEMNDFFGMVPRTPAGLESDVGPTYDDSITDVLVAEDDGLGGDLTVTVKREDGPDETYEFSITQVRSPRLCSYGWSSGRLPTAVTHAVYKHGYAIENVDTFPHYDPQLEKLVAIGRWLNITKQEFESIYSDSPLIPKECQVCISGVIAAERAARTRLVLTDAEYERIAGEIRAAVDDATDGETLSLMFSGPPTRLVELFHDIAADIVEARDSDVERTVPADALQDNPTGEFPYRTEVTEDGEYVHAFVIHEDSGIERFSFRQTDGGVYEPATPHTTDEPHTAAVNAVFQAGYEVRGYIDLTPKTGVSDTRETVESIITLVETIEARFGEMDEQSIPAMCIGMLTPSLENLRLVLAYYEELGQNRFDEVCADVDFENTPKPEWWSAFTSKLDGKYPDFFDETSLEFDRVREDFNRKQQEGEMVPSYTLGQ